MPRFPSPRRSPGIIRALWARRRWAYAAYMLVAILRIPARVGFRLVLPVCDARFTPENAGLSLTKLPHLVLFGAFFVLTVFQFDHLDLRAFWWSALAAGALGLLVEIEEGATRTGNCRITDILPDLLGALVAAAVLWAFIALRRRSSRSNRGLNAARLNGREHR
jgi:hypothetical protein